MFWAIVTHLVMGAICYIWGSKRGYDAGAEDAEAAWVQRLIEEGYYNK